MAEVVILSLRNQLAIVSALLALGRVGFVELVDDYVTVDATVALTQLPRDLRLTSNLLSSIFTSQG